MASVVGLDGGYVRDWDDRKVNFELIVGWSMPEDRDPGYIGLVHGYDRKSKPRLFELLKTQGLQADHNMTFLTDHGEEVCGSAWKFGSGAGLVHG